LSSPTPSAYHINHFSQEMISNFEDEKSTVYTAAIETLLDPQLSWSFVRTKTGCVNTGIIYYRKTLTRTQDTIIIHKYVGVIT